MTGGQPTTPADDAGVTHVRTAQAHALPLAAGQVGADATLLAEIGLVPLLQTGERVAHEVLTPSGIAVYGMTYVRQQIGAIRLTNAGKYLIRHLLVGLDQRRPQSKIRRRAFAEIGLQLVIIDPIDAEIDAE